MNYDDKEYFKMLMSVVIGWRLSGAKSVVLLCIFNHLYIEKSEFVKITIEDFIEETHYSRQSVVDALQYLLDRSIITRKLDKNNKNYLYSIIIYDMCDSKKIEGVMKSYNKKGSGYSSWIASNPKEKQTETYPNRYRYETVDIWTYNDFSFFAEAFMKYFSEKNKIDISNVQFNINSSFRRNQSYLNIVDYLHKKSGNNFCKLMLKAYMEWYIVNIFQNILSKLKIIDGKKQLHIYHFNDKYAMQLFLDKHTITENMKSISDVEVRLSSYKKILKKDSKEFSSKNIHSVTAKDMKKYYSLGISTLLHECGIVLAGNYLIEYEQKTFQQAADEIGKYLNSLNISHERQKNALVAIVDKTCIASPYYKTLKFLNWHCLYAETFNRLEDKFDISSFKITESLQRNSYDFLVEKEKVEA